MSRGFPYLLRLTLLLLPLLVGPVGALAQTGEWNSPRVRELIRAAREVRQSHVVDAEFQSYSSRARGYVYFFLEREDTGERVLVKTDQIALEVFWKAPDLTRQRIVGLRDEKSLPTNIQYHLDHLLVVQDEFGDRIQVGGGDEVEAVTHPAAPGSESLYDFLLADSVSLILQGAADTVRVYEVQVRPKDFERPGFVGSLFLDRSTHAIVRLSFTFTPASYVDDYLDYIQISLENGLWLGRHWLPYRQELEIRREVPYLDIPAGSVIRGWFEVRDYEINPPLPDFFFSGPVVTAMPEAARRAFPFEDSLHAHLEEEGLAGLRSPPSMEEIQALAQEIARDRYLSGLQRLRLFLPQPTVSSALRYNRTEGLFLGGGFSYGLAPTLGLAVYGGFSFGRERPALSFTAFGGERRPHSRLRAFWNEPVDLGPVPAISGVLNTLAALTMEDDYRDLYFATGLRASHLWTLRSGWSLGMEGRREAHRSGRDVVSDGPEGSSFRPVLPVDDGTWTSLSLRALFPTPWEALQGEMKILGGAFGDRGFGALEGAASVRRSWPTRGWEAQGDLQAGLLLGRAPVQAHYFLGGRETVPGHAFRSRVGDRFWLARAEASRSVLAPWARLRVLAAAGCAWGRGEAPASLPSTRSRCVPVASAGLGVGLGWDILRLDLARGVGGGGDWALMLSVNPQFWPWL